MALPSLPSAMGVFHTVARYGLAVPFGVPGDLAVAIATAAHAFQYIALGLLGLAGLAREGLSLGWLRRQVDHVQEGES